MATAKKMRKRRRISTPPDAVMESERARWLWPYAKSNVTFTLATVAATSGLDEASFDTTVQWFTAEGWIEQVAGQRAGIYVGRI